MSLQESDKCPNCGIYSRNADSESYNGEEYCSENNCNSCHRGWQSHFKFSHNTLYEE